MNNPFQEEKKVSERKSSERPRVVNYTDYLKLKQNNETLKRKNEKLIFQKKELQSILDSMQQSVKQVHESFQSISTIYNTLAKVDELKQYLNPVNSSNYARQTDFSLKGDTESNISLNKQRGLLEKDLKKIEELEYCLSEMTKNYNFIVVKYKYLLLEREKNEAEKIGKNQEFDLLKEEKMKLESEKAWMENKIERQKVTEKCLIDSISSSFTIMENKYSDLNVSLKAREAEKSRQLIEPVPSFLKFMK
jgi:hypothetical protein